MGPVSEFPRCLVIVALLWNPEKVILSDIQQDIELNFGRIVAETVPIAYQHSDYYTGEMGGPLQKKWVAFTPITPHSIASLKHCSQKLETKYATNGRRTINIDPGLLFAHNLILLSTKNYAHRLPISDGIYGELELIFRKKKWIPLPWTYPDYQSPELLIWLTQLRQLI